MCVFDRPTRLNLKTPGTVGVFSLSIISKDTAYLAGVFSLFSLTQMVCWLRYEALPFCPSPKGGEGGRVVDFSSDFLGFSRKWQSFVLRFDIIVVDSTDFGAAQPLFEEGFHRGLRNLLAVKGVLVPGMSGWCFGSQENSEKSSEIESNPTFLHFH